jgi:hypothetical protein
MGSLLLLPDKKPYPQGDKDYDRQNNLHFGSYLFQLFNTKFKAYFKNPGTFSCEEAPRPLHVGV